MRANRGFQRFWGLMQLQRLLFALAWRTFLLLYLGIGLGALAVMFLIETQFFLQITGHLYLSYAIATILECTKVGTSVIKQALAIARRVAHIRMSTLFYGVTAVFQIALILLSLLCSVTVVSAVLEGTTLLPFHSGRAQHPPRVSGSLHPRPSRPMVFTALNILRESVGVEVSPALCITGLAVLLSVLLQGTIYIVFGHLVATQTDELEYIFQRKYERADAKKNSRLNR